MKSSKTGAYAYAWNIVRTATERILRKLSPDNPGSSVVIWDISSSSLQTFVRDRNNLREFTLFLLDYKNKQEL